MIWKGILLGAILGAASLVSAQQEEHEHADQASAMSEMPGMETPSALDWLPSMHSGSGTAWQPAVASGHMWMWRLGRGWDLMAHGTIFLDYNQQGGPRGVGKAESVNYAMVMEQHSLWGGSLLFRQMYSAESLTSPHPGFPQLFQTGETYHGEPLVDHQHPHNVFSELSAYYLRPLTESVRWFVYGGPAAEPALGPVTYIHRNSASELPAAPLGHHLQDSTHTSFGVITSGVIFPHFKIEGSAFNGREPNEQRWSIQLNPLDSWSVRGTVAPTPNWTAQYSYGLLLHPEAAEPGDERRETASIEYVRNFEEGSWASTVVWGRKQKIPSNTILNSYLFESTVNFRSRNYAFTRLELVDKDELFPEAATHPAYRIGAYTFGGVRDLVHAPKWQLGLGADIVFYSKPAVLDATYGSNPISFQVFLRLRPGKTEHNH
jgi:hypothetical protein